MYEIFADWMNENIMHLTHCCHGEYGSWRTCRRVFLVMGRYDRGGPSLSHWELAMVLELMSVGLPLHLRKE